MVAAIPSFQAEQSDFCSPLATEPVKPPPIYAVVIKLSAKRLACDREKQI